jgi:hypothetical protein
MAALNCSLEMRDVSPQGSDATDESGLYFCQVRFLWRLARIFFRRLCLLILALRRFFNDPIVVRFDLT